MDKIRFDTLLDLAVLKITDSGGQSPADLDVASLLPLDTHGEVGQFVFAIGNSLSNYSNTVTMGIL